MELAAAVDFSYSYNFPSALQPVEGRNSLNLATFGGRAKNPYFFGGRLLSPRRVADILLALSAISRTRFFSPGLLRERMVAAADPVVTCDGEQLRFEVFSVCCGVYARFDLTGDALAGQWLSKGTTNVDFNPPFRASLASLQNSDSVDLFVGSDSVELSKGGETAVERKVKLPVRWLKSFVEVQSYLSDLKPYLELSVPELSKLLVAMPEQNILQAGVVSYITPIARGYRLSQRDVVGALGVGAVSRLKALEPLLRLTSSIRAYSSQSNVTAFELTMPEGRFIFVLSPRADRGFSGEGQALLEIAGRVSDETIAAVRAQLSWQSNLEAETISRLIDCSSEDVNNAFKILGARGLVGYDIAGGSFYHRELPFDLSLVEELHPRLKKARELVESKAVRIIEGGSNEAGTVSANVRGTSGEHLVQIGDEAFRCTCDWHVKHGGARGPCSHVLALELKLQESQQ